MELESELELQNLQKCPKSDSGTDSGSGITTPLRSIISCCVLARIDFDSQRDRIQEDGEGKRRGSKREGLRARVGRRGSEKQDRVRESSVNLGKTRGVT